MNHLYKLYFYHVATWLSNQRQFNKGKRPMPTERIELLQKLVDEGRLVWDGTDLGGRRRHSEVAWPTNYAALLKYREEFGHCNFNQSSLFKYTTHGPNGVDVTYTVQLGKWLTQQKQTIKEGIRRRGLTNERMALLKGLVDNKILMWPDVVFPESLTEPVKVEKPPKINDSNVLQELTQACEYHDDGEGEGEGVDDSTEAGGSQQSPENQPSTTTTSKRPKQTNTNNTYSTFQSQLNFYTLCQNDPNYAIIANKTDPADTTTQPSRYDVRGRNSDLKRGPKRKLPFSTEDSTTTTTTNTTNTKRKSKNTKNTDNTNIIPLPAATETNPSLALWQALYEGVDTSEFLPVEEGVHALSSVYSFFNGITAGDAPVSVPESSSQTTFSSSSYSHTPHSEQPQPHSEQPQPHPEQKGDLDTSEDPVVALNAPVEHEHEQHVAVVTAREEEETMVREGERCV